MTAYDLFASRLSNPAHFDLPVTNLTQNSANAHFGSVFVCIRGAKTDGHRFAKNAYENGCRLFVAEEALNLPEDAGVISSEDTERDLSLLAAAFYGNPSRSMQLIGITGTKGKTTTAQLIFQILNENGVPCGYIGTNGIRYGKVNLPTVNTTPDAITLQKTLSDMQKSGIQTAVIEVSSQAILRKRIDGVRFDTVLFTNLSPDHIGKGEHADYADYRACKHRLFTDYGANTVIWNQDDPAAAEMLENTSASIRISCSAKDRTATFYATDIALYKSMQSLGVSFFLHHKSDAVTVRLPLAGKMNAANALLSLATVCTRFGISPQRAANALLHAKVDGRSEWIPLPNGGFAVIDYAHNAVSLESILSTLRTYAPDRLICLFGSVGERTKLRRRELGSVAARYADLCILTSDNPGKESPQAILAEIEQAFEGTSTPYFSIPDRTEAIRRAVSLTRPGDILLLAGKGHETYQLIGSEKVPFCERDLIAEAWKTPQK